MGTFIAIIQFVFTLDIERLLNTLLIVFINQYTGASIKKADDVIKFFENPKVALKFVSQIPKQQIDLAMKELQEQNKDLFRELEKQRKENETYSSNLPQQEIDKANKDLQEQNKDLYKSTEQKRKEAEKNDTQTLNLNSSWLKKARFKKTSEKFSTGELTIWTNSDKDKKKRWYGPYTYPLVEIKTWNSMKNARGKNGSGAGSVFWKYYLHAYYPSAFRRYVLKNWGSAKLSTLTRNYAQNPDRREKYRTNSNYDRERLVNARKERINALKKEIKQRVYTNQSKTFKDSLNRNKKIVEAQRTLKKAKKVIRTLS